MLARGVRGGARQQRAIKTVVSRDRSANTSLSHSRGVDHAKLVDLPCVATIPVIMSVAQDKVVSGTNGLIKRCNLTAVQRTV